MEAQKETTNQKLHTSKNKQATGVIIVISMFTKIVQHSNSKVVNVKQRVIRQLNIP